ncbi:hypothetical protein ACWCOV_16800 [Kribbella sp. NPDC002412]
MDSEDPRRRPVVLATGGDDQGAARRPARYLAWAGSGLLGLVAAAGLIAGGTAVWSAFDPGTPGPSPAPLWFPPPETIRPQTETVTPTPTPSRTPDDHGGDRTRTPKPSDDSRTTEPGDDRTAEPGDDRTTEPGDGKSTDRSGEDRSGSDSGSSGSGESTEDNSGHR